MRTSSKWLASVALTLGLLIGASVGANTGKAPEEGFDYRLIQPAQQTDKSGRIEVLEFFWYGCRHCLDLEPMFENWSKQQAKDVVVRKVPVAFDQARQAHSRIYYALEALGKLDAMHMRVFNAIHVERKPLLKEDEIADFMAQNGIDRSKWISTYNSFSVIAKVNTANKIAAAYRVEGVPTMAVQGKYLTSPSIAGGSKARSLEVMDWLIAQTREKK